MGKLLEMGKTIKKPGKEELLKKIEEYREKIKRIEGGNNEQG